MKHVVDLLKTVTERMEALAAGNAVVGEQLSVGDRHVIPLMELSLGMGAGGGVGEATGEQGGDPGKGQGGGLGGGAKVTPVAFVIVDGEDVRVETLGS